jgi:hypothetical protein
MRGFYQLTLGTLILTACGASTPPPEEPASEMAAVDSSDDVEQTAAGEKGSGSDGTSETDAPQSAPPAAATAAPEFKDGMSVDEAMKAVPQGTATVNIEQEALSRPLMDEKVYEPCKLGAAHFKLKVAVWDGKAVGIDATTTPKNEKLAQCIKSQVAGLTWPDKVKSLNTVEYQL